MGVRSKLDPATLKWHGPTGEAEVIIRTDATHMEITGPCGASHTLPLHAVQDLIAGIENAFAARARLTPHQCANATRAQDGADTTRAGA